MLARSRLTPTAALDETEKHARDLAVLLLRDLEAGALDSGAPWRPSSGRAGSRRAQWLR